MKEVKEKLLQLEDEFINLKKKIERYHLILLIIVLGSPIAFVLILNKSSDLTLKMKLILFSIMFAGLIVHLYIRNKFYKSHSGFNKYIKKNITRLKNDIALDDKYKEKIIKMSSEILTDRGISLKDDKMSNYPFWELLIKNLDD